jgi:hypothetical protein
MKWHGLQSSGSRYGYVEGSCGHRNEASGSIKWWEYLHYMKNYQLFKKDSVPRSWLAIYNNYTLSLVLSSPHMESLTFKVWEI